MSSREQQIKEMQEANKAVLEVLKEVPKALPALAIKGFTGIVVLFLFYYITFSLGSQPVVAVVALGLLIFGMIVWLWAVEKVTGLDMGLKRDSGRRSGGQGRGSYVPPGTSGWDTSGFGDGGGACDGGGSDGGGGGGDGGGGGCDGGGGGGW